MVWTNGLASMNGFDLMNDPLIYVCLLFGIAPAMIMGFFLGRAYQIRQDIINKYKGKLDDRNTGLIDKLYEEQTRLRNERNKWRDLYRGYKVEGYLEKLEMNKNQTLSEVKLEKLEFFKPEDFTSGYYSADGVAHSANILLKARGTVVNIKTTGGEWVAYSGPRSIYDKDSEQGILLFQPIAKEEPDTAESLLREEVQRMESVMSEGLVYYSKNARDWFNRAKKVLGNK